MESAAVPVQTTEKGRLKRPQEAKIGRVKYTLQLIKDLRRDMEEIKLSQRTILAGLKGLFHFGKPMIQRIACGDEVDVEILQMLREAGGVGLLPKDLAARLTAYKVMRRQVSRRIIRMNRKLEKELGELLVEKRGWHWALTSFGNEVWDDEAEPSSRPWKDGELKGESEPVE
jgi:hypothetical protein